VSDSLSALKEIEWREEDPEKWLGSPPLVEMARMNTHARIRKGRKRYGEGREMARILHTHTFAGEGM
jgi:hypothetical protein